MASGRALSAELGPHSLRATTVWLALGLLVLTAAVYAPVRNYGFIKLDDPVYVTQNRHVQGGLSLDGFVWAWSAPHSATWHPLTSLSHMLDCQLFGLNPGPQHLGNLVLHVLNTLLLFGFLVHTTARPWPSVCAAALFALHPLHVESVAWISERKDVLSTFFWLLTLWAYAAYVTRPVARRYVLVLMAYAAALLSKPMVVTLPAVLLLLDVWPLKRLGSAGEQGSRGAGEKGSQSARVRGRSGAQLPGSPAPALPCSPASLVLEKLPLVLMAALVSAITLVVQMRAGATIPAIWPPLADRAANALVSYAAYLASMLWPARLAVFYPFEAPLPTWQMLLAALLLLTTTALVLWQRQQRAYLLIGWLWYLVTLVPVIGLLPFGDQAMADRYTYVPSIGIFIMTAWGIPDLFRRWPQRQVVCAAVAVSALLACIILTSRQLERWRDSMSLFAHALSVTRNNFVAQFCMGLALLDQGRRDEAAARFSESLRIRPTYEPAHYEMGRLLAADGALEAAKQEYLAAARLNPTDARVYVHVAQVFAKQDQLDAAQTWMRRAIDAAPDDPEIRFNVGILAASVGDWEGAVAAHTAAVRLSPDYVAAHRKLADALLNLGRRGEAIQEYTVVLQADPRDTDTQDRLGVALTMEKRFDEAVRAFRQAVTLKPDFAEAYNHWGVALSMQGRFDAAIERYHEALRYDPTSETTQTNLHAAEKDRDAGQTAEVQ